MEVDGITVAKATAIQNGSVVSAYISSGSGHLIFVKGDGTEVDAGAPFIPNVGVNITGDTTQFNTALTDNDFATLDGVETLTNKTLTNPLINLTPTDLRSTVTHPSGVTLNMLNGYRLGNLMIVQADILDTAARSLGDAIITGLPTQFESPGSPALAMAANPVDGGYRVLWIQSDGSITVGAAYTASASREHIFTAVYAGAV